jgi:hypothetical protein
VRGLRSLGFGFADMSWCDTGKICEWGLSVQHGILSEVAGLLWCSGVASQLIGTPVADAPAKAGLSVQQHPYRAVRGIRGGIHRSAEIHRKVVAEVVA